MNIINFKRIFFKSKNPEDAIQRIERYKEAGIKGVYFNNYCRMSLEDVKSIIESKSKQGYSLYEMYSEILANY